MVIQRQVIIYIEVTLYALSHLYLYVLVIHTHTHSKNEKKRGHFLREAGRGLEEET